MSHTVLSNPNLAIWQRPEVICSVRLQIFKIFPVRDLLTVLTIRVA